jgi:hypothetical protein
MTATFAKLTPGIAIVDDSGAPTVWFIQYFGNTLSQLVNSFATAQQSKTDFGGLMVMPAVTFPTIADLDQTPPIPIAIALSDLDQTPPQQQMVTIDDVSAALNSVRDEVAILRARIDDILKGLVVL